MTVATYRRLWCDHADCGAWYGNADLPNVAAKELRRGARIGGWRRTRDGRDLCPDRPEPAV